MKKITSDDIRIANDDYIKAKKNKTKIHIYREYSAKIINRAWKKAVVNKHFRK